MTYAEIVEAIAGHAQRGIEERFAIGTLVGLAIDAGHDLENVAADVGISVLTLGYYAHAAAFWGADRIPVCSVWSVYTDVAYWPAEFVTAHDVRRRAISEGRSAIEELRPLLHRRLEPKPVDPDRGRRLVVRSAVTALKQAHWSLLGVKVEGLSNEERKELAAAAFEIVKWAQRLRIATEKAA